MKNKTFSLSILTKILASVFVIILITGTLFFYAEYHEAKTRIKENLKRQINFQVLRINDKIEVITNFVTIMSEIETNLINNIKFSSNTFHDFLKIYLDEPLFSDIAYINAPEDSTALYFFKAPGQVIEKNLNEMYSKSKESYKERDWYKVAIKRKTGYWSTPTYNPDDNLYAVTYSFPIEKEGKLNGLLLYDIPLTWLLKDVDSTIGKTKLGIFIDFGSNQIISNDSFDKKVLEKIKSLKNIKKDSQIFIDNNEYQFYSIPILDNNSFIIAYYNLSRIENVLNVRFWSDFSIFVLFLIVLFAILLIVINKSLSPIKDTCNKLKQMSEGNFNIVFNTTSNIREILLLQKSAQKLQQHLINYKKNLEREAKIRTEINFSKLVKSSLIPHKTKQLSNDIFDIHWLVKSTRQNESFFCNFKNLDNKKIFISMGESIHLKGYSNLFLPTVVLAAENTQINQDTNLSEFVNMLNNEIFRISNNNAFLAYYCIMIDLNNGESVYINAGYSNPIRIDINGIQLKNSTKNENYLGRKGLILHSESIRIGTGELIFLYTDINRKTKAVAINYNDIIVNTLSQNRELTAAKIVGKVYRTLRKIDQEPSNIESSTCMMCYKHKKNNRIK